MPGLQSSAIFDGIQAEDRLGFKNTAAALTAFRLPVQRLCHDRINRSIHTRGKDQNE
jgi:hypothetical protein